MRLIIPILLNCILVLAVYLANKYTPAKKLPYMAKQAVIGLLFGCLSAFAWVDSFVVPQSRAPVSVNVSVTVLPVSICVSAGISCAVTITALDKSRLPDI